MKKSILSLMLIGMMTLGTTNSFGSVKNSPKTEKVVKNTRDCTCKTCMELKKKEMQKQKKVQKKNQCTCKTCQQLHKQHGQTSTMHKKNKFKR